MDSFPGLSSRLPTRGYAVVIVKRKPQTRNLNINVDEPYELKETRENQKGEQEALNGPNKWQLTLPSCFPYSFLFPLDKTTKLK